MLAVRRVATTPSRLSSRPAIVQRSGQDFSTATRWNDKFSNSSRSQPTGNENPGQLPKFSLKDLQASPTVKVVIYTMIGVIATAETYTYGLWAYNRWWKPQEGDERRSID